MYPAIIELIPHRPPFLFVDEIVSSAAGVLVARRTWRQEEAFYDGHYPGAPITPGVLLCESVVQTGAVLLALEQRGGGERKGLPILVKINDVRFRLPVYPGDVTEMEVRQKEWLGVFGLMAGSMKCGDKRILNIDFTVTFKDPGGAPTVSPPA